MRLRVPVLEAIWVRKERGIEGGLALDEHCLSMTVMNAVRCHVADARVAVRGVVPVEERLAARRID